MTLSVDLDFLSMRSNWDILVVDEGHKAKNIHTKFRKNLKEFPVTR